MWSKFIKNILVYSFSLRLFDRNKIKLKGVLCVGESPTCTSQVWRNAEDKQVKGKVVPAQQNNFLFLLFPSTTTGACFCFLLVLFWLLSCPYMHKIRQAKKVKLSSSKKLKGSENRAQEEDADKSLEKILAASPADWLCYLFPCLLSFKTWLSVWVKSIKTTTTTAKAAYYSYHQHKEPEQEH